jgi:hypothetical protein
MSFAIANIANTVAAAVQHNMGVVTPEGSNNALGLEENYGQVVFKKIMELSQIRIHREQVQEALDAYHKAQKEQDVYNAAEQGEKVLLLTTPYNTDLEWHLICKRIEGELEQLKKTEEAEEDGEVQEYSPGKLQYPLSPTPTLIQDNELTSDWSELSDFEEVLCCRCNNKGKKPQCQVRHQKCISNLKSVLKKAQQQDSEDRWPSPEPTPWDPAPIESVLAWSPFKDEEQAVRCRATVWDELEKQDGQEELIKHVRWSKEAADKARDEDWGPQFVWNPQAHPAEVKFPAGVPRPWEANYWSLKEEAVPFWNLIVTNGEGCLLKYNKSRLQRLQRRAGSNTWKEDQELKILQLAAQKWALDQSDKATLEYKSIPQQCWTCQYRHSVSRCSKCGHVIGGMVAKDKDYVRAKMWYVAGRELRAMQQSKGLVAGAWRDTWTEMLNHIEKF